MSDNRTLQDQPMDSEYQHLLDAIKRVEAKVDALEARLMPTIIVHKQEIPYHTNMVANDLVIKQ